jgi:NAD-dependent DNA ligase
MDIAGIVATLREAADAYYNGAPLKMDDDTYDALLDRLKELDPENPYLDTVGATPVGVVATLPYPMPSLDKIKPEQDALDRFLATGPFVISEKLDGLSALWIAGTRSLYLRGNGIEGQDISHLVDQGLQGLGKEGHVRGELVVSRSLVGTLSRSWVNGIIHRKDVTEEVKKIRFVAYDLMRPSGFTRAKQFEWLAAKGYEVPWWQVAAKLTVEDLKKALQSRRETSTYDTDGIVVGFNAVPVRPSPGKNPKDAVAFKMPLLDQSATTTVINVIWATSAQGYLIPKLEFEPVTIGGATIRFCTAHNARTVVHNKLGPGSSIVIRRSGDVIPTLDRVLVGTVAQLPEGVWDATNTHLKATSDSAALTVAKLHHFLKTLKIPGAGPATAAALVDAGMTGPADIWKATGTQLSATLGPKTGATLYESLRALKPTEIDLMVASSLMPRSVGETKLKALQALNPDCRTWSAITAAPGWTSDSLDTFKSTLPAYKAWRTSETCWIPYPVLNTQGHTVAAAVKGTICFTGFRDKNLEEEAHKKGFAVASVLTARTTILAIPDGPVKESEKVKTAIAKGLKMLSRTELAQYLDQHA